MKATNAAISNAYDAAGKLLDKEAPAVIIFKIADLIEALKPKAESLSVAINSIIKDIGTGEEAKKQLIDLLGLETEVSYIPVITRNDLESLGTITLRTYRFLLPFLKEDEN